MNDERLTVYHRRLPIGEPVPLGSIADSDLFPFEGQIRTRPLEPPIIPEPSRHGEGGEDCGICADGTGALWRDDEWRLRASQPSGLPIVAVLIPNAHHDLEDLPPHLAGQLGIMIQRVARAIGRIRGVGRVHVNRWGDGSAHFHVWFLARPFGMWQLRGACLALWDDMLPAIPEAEWHANVATVAQALAEEGGELLTDTGQGPV